MSSVRRRRLAAAPVAVAMTLLLGGCGTGFSAQTNQVYQPAVGANARGDVDSLNTLLVANDDGTATLSATLYNTLAEEQSLSSVTITTLGGDPLEVRSTKSLVNLPPRQLTTLGTVDAGGSFTLTSGADAGAYVTVTFTFAGSAPLTVEAPIVARNAEYDSITGGAAAGEAETGAEAEAETAE